MRYAFMKSEKPKTPEERKFEAAKDQEFVIPETPATHGNDRPLFHGHPKGNVEKLIEHGRQMGF